ncbi:S-methyl-5'-thioadenosine phosphorylase [Streptomyces sp. CSDS2]|uniref:S-methyl-5'-thioadenosine phosphorylase n=1 Tax=Streptomyces sp. CSDS2 TaxID=3055051 RepID=UPI0025AFCB73|nr:S-methyl-5'-thioadenosine phosphorylase [Streptomyces sp. CSDS2]MDN3258611.1 S-methyl-5'-thioadenosine phosphorylase [Streptomyces sp. CSDS2]
MTTPAPDIAVIGGSGLYTLLDDGQDITVDTPYGAPSAPPTVGTLGGRTVAFLPRHGRRHEFPPHRVDYRANLWALKELGVTRVLATGAVGSLTRDIPPGSLVVPDQLVDRTTGRTQTFFDGPHVAHATFADPYCEEGRTVVLKAADRCGWGAVDGGVQVVIDGPRFSTRAESRWYAAQGWSLIGMTAHPEVALARELGLCCVPLCLVTDHDAGVEAGTGVTQEAVMEAFRANLQRLRDVLAESVAALPNVPMCSCRGLRPAPL